jgi:uncharacterized protein (DUF342 family)
MKSTEIPNTKDLGISDDVLKRLDEADTSELDSIEQELGIHAPEAVDEVEDDTAESSEVLEGPAVIEEEGEEISQQEPIKEPIKDPLKEPIKEPIKEPLIDSEVEREQQGEKVDSRVEIRISDDKMNVLIDLYPSKGAGVPLSFEKVKTQLHSMKVVHGVNYELLKRLVENAERTKQAKSGVAIAQGTPPEEGKDGSVEFLFSENEDILQYEKEDEVRKE